jgi:hypothetical protein
MKVASIILAIVAFVTGLIAARYWYRSSRVAIDPGWGMPGTGGQIEPVLEELRGMDIQVATTGAFDGAGQLNAAAALWTAASAAASAVSSILGAMA